MPAFRVNGILLLQRPGKAPASAPPPDLPGIPTLARNAAQAALDTARGILTAGRLTVSEETAAARLATCEACLPPEGYFLAGTDRCTHPKCGCFLRLKTRLYAQRCPAGKW